MLSKCWLKLKLTSFFDSLSGLKHVSESERILELRNKLMKNIRISSSLCDKDKIYFFPLKSRVWPFDQAKETKSTNISFISLHWKLSTNMTSQGKGKSTRNNETNVSLFAGT